MSVRLRAVQNDRDPILSQLRGWYESSIPHVERIPWEELLRRACTDAHLFEVRSEDRSVGMAFGHQITPGGGRPALGYLQYLVVDPALRGGGLGAHAYRAVRERLAAGQSLILEVEDPARCDDPADRHLAQRRIAFYERLGLRQLAVDYRQPPAAPGLPWWPMVLMLDAPAASAASAAEEEAAVETFLEWISEWDPQSEK